MKRSEYYQTLLLFGWMNCTTPKSETIASKEYNYYELMYLVYVVVVVQIIVNMFLVIMPFKTLTSMAAEFINVYGMLSFWGPWVYCDWNNCRYSCVNTAFKSQGVTDGVH